MGPCQELPGRGGVADGGGVVEAEHHGEVQRVGAAGEGFLELPVDAQPVQGRREPSQAPQPCVADGPGAGSGPAADEQVRVGGVRPACLPAGEPVEQHLVGEVVQLPGVRRIFAEYLAGRSLFAIAEGLARDRVPSPFQHDAARNTHRTGEGWAKSAVRVIVRNPRYTGRQVWNKQRKDEILLDVNDVARGYETRLRWNDTGRARQASRETRERVRNPYALRGRLYCGFCERRMQGQYNHGDAYYRCRYPKSMGMLIGRHRRYTGYGARGGPPDDPISRHHRVPPGTMVMVMVMVMAIEPACATGGPWSSGTVSPRGS